MKGIKQITTYCSFDSWVMPKVDFVGIESIFISCCLLLCQRNHGRNQNADIVTQSRGVY